MPLDAGFLLKLLKGTSANTTEDGLIEAGNINLENRPRVRNADGSISTVRSMGVNIDGQEILLPTVSDDGRIMTNEEAMDQYYKTGKHLGIFTSAEASDRYAQQLHQQQEQMLGVPSRKRVP